MPQTIYAAFNDVNLAERAAGALMDHGVLQQDISLISNADRGQITTNADSSSINSSTVSARNTGDSAIDHTKSAGDRLSEAGDRAMAGVTGAVGATGTSANYDAAADERAQRAVDREAMARNEGAVRDTNYIADTSGAGDVSRGASNLGDGMVDATKSAGDRVAQAGNRTAAAVTGAVGADAAAARYDAAADERAMRAEDRSAMARNEDVVHDRPVGTTVNTTPLGDTEYDRRDVAAYASDSTTDTVDDTNRDHTVGDSGLTTTTGGDAAAGAAKGASIGLGLGVLGGLATLLIPGVGFVTGMGALATAIGAGLGTTAAGAITGGVYGFLKDQGVDEAVAQDYQHAIEHGGAMLSVHVPSGDIDGAAVQDLLNKYGANNVRSY